MSAAFNTPQFNTAEYSDSQNTCQYCRQPISGTYYRVRSAMSCPACTDKIRAAMAKNNSSAYPLALVCGMGAAILGMILYATFTILTGWVVSYVALAVGWMVGTAIKKGSGGSGGRRYQITAALLTYVAISMSSLPIGLHYARQRQQAMLRAQLYRSFGSPERALTHEQQQAREQDLAARQRQLEDEFGQPHAGRAPLRPHSSPSPASSTAQQPDTFSQSATPSQVPQSQAPHVQFSKPNVPPPNFFAFLRQMLWLTIGSPFALLWLKGPTLGSFLNIAILSIGIIFAWRITAGVNLVVYGPFDAPTQPTR